ncbi:hypothetical protein MKK65_16295 [Methylobacterium sp. J-001]|uniref:hypothetical protein n=1 Tax=Methylobacterium sp. J-001 TaxID=2836609 RepID=UPI001FB9D307|nr:hypothetical protein [Methylobacterium sp. J-001]MCJ2118109.1 hypothetical protein [Methylobacterium sp. J-001]
MREKRRIRSSGPVPAVGRRSGGGVTALALGLTLLGQTVSGGRAQSVTDLSALAIGPDDTQAVLALIGRHLHSTDAQVAGLRRGRTGGICGTVEVRNRMGTYTGPRPFVAKVDADFAGRLPEGAELRNPGSMAEYSRLERARAMFVENCIDR